MRVLGRVPGVVGSLVPGRSVGFMPQELALYEEFTAHQNFLFYGKLFGMSDAAIREREAFLLSFLHLPPSTRPIKQLSGGQQRRVSLACALLHSPPLLLLDEPTVGVDPVLRARIWSHLRTLSAEGSTIVITTHYIEEARQADYVGFMRGGRILQEGRPDDVIAQHGCRSLEEVFLHLCKRAEEQDEDDAGGDDHTRQEDAQALDQHEEDEEAQRRRKRTPAEAKGEEDLDDEPADEQPSVAMDGSLSTLDSNGAISPSSLPLSTMLSAYLPRWSFLLACIWRNLTRFRLNIPALLFVFLLPSVQVILFCIAIGKDPQDISIGLVNHDAGGNYSDAFDSNLQRSGLLVQHFDTDEQALQAAKANEVWGYAIIPTNYSHNLDGLFHDPLDNPYGDGCIIRYSIDSSDEQIAVYMTTAIVEAYEDTLDGILPSNLRRNYPLQALPPVYGTPTSSFTDFIAPVRPAQHTPAHPQHRSASAAAAASLTLDCAVPVVCVRCVLCVCVCVCVCMQGIIITIAFSQSIGLTALTLVVDKKSGVLDRGWSAGIRASEMMASHALTQLCILTVQIWLLLFFGLVVFHLPMVGSILLVFTTCLLLAFCGMLYGLTIAAVCTEERQALQLALGSFFPAILLSGVVRHAPTHTLHHTAHAWHSLSFSHVLSVCALWCAVLWCGVVCV